MYHELEMLRLKIDKQKFSENDSVLVLDPNEDFLDNFEALFVEPVDQDLEQPRVSFVVPFKHGEGTKTGTQSLKH